MVPALALTKGDLIIDPYRGPGILLYRTNLWECYTDEQNCWVWEVEWSHHDTNYSICYNINELNLIRLVENGIIKHYKSGGHGVGWQ